MFLAIRMIIYVLAVPLATYIGGTFDPETGNLTINIDSLLNVGGGLAVVATTFASSRWAKVKGWAT